MSDTERAEELAPSPARAGERLRLAREAQGLSLVGVAERTRVPLRHLEAIEAGDYESLPSPTYATGFARAYARTVGVDEVAVAREVRAEASKLGRRQPEYEPYVTADPARLPSRALAIVTAGVALGVIVLAALWLGSGWLRGGGGGTGGTGGAALPPVAVAPAAPSRPVAAASAVPRQVTLTANDEIWMRVYDGANRTLFLGTMKPGDRFDVPQGADRPMVNVGRADKLAVTLDGRPVAPLGTGERPIRDVAVDAASIAARAAAGAAPAGMAAATPAPTRVPPPTATAALRTGDPSPTPRRSAGDEVERANRLSERAARRGVAPPVPADATPGPAAASATPRP